MSRNGQLVRVIGVQPLKRFVLRVAFDDGKTRDVDVEELLHGPIFEPVRTDPELFRQVRVESGTIVWPNGADINPVVLYGSARPARGDDEAGTRS